MFDISAISNRDLQVLYEYRILRRPADKLTAILGGESFTTHIQEDSVVEDEWYTYYLDTTPKEGQVPFLEFVAKTADDWRALAHLSKAEITEDGIKLYSTAEVPTDMSVRIYWCRSLNQIESMLNDIAAMLGQFDADFEKLKEDIEYLKDHAVADSRPDGLVNNLVKIQKIEDKGTLVDSLYTIKKPEAKRVYVNISQKELDTMLHTFNESVEFRFMDNLRRVMQNWNGPIMKISGRGNLILRNIKSQILISDWKGYITITDCPDVHLQAESEDKICNIEHLKIMRNSCVYLENYTHYIEYLTLLLNSTVRHRRGYVKSISYVGYGCTYWCADTVWIPGINYFSESDHTQNTVYNFNVLDILGTLQHDGNALLIYNSRCIGFKVANADVPSQPRIVNVDWDAQYSGGDDDRVYTPYTSWYWSGDSRTVGLINTTHTDGQGFGGAGLSTLQSHKNDIISGANQHNLALWWGVNGLEAGYPAVYEEIATALSTNAVVFVCTVGRVFNTGGGTMGTEGGSGDTPVEEFNERIEIWNDRLKEDLKSYTNIHIIDVWAHIEYLMAQYSQLELAAGVGNGLHYSALLNQKIYDYCESCITHSQSDKPTPLSEDTPRNFVYNALIANTSFTKTILCAILGNLSVDSGFDPFLKTDVKYGLW